MLRARFGAAGKINWSDHRPWPSIQDGTSSTSPTRRSDDHFGRLALPFTHASRSDGNMPFDGTFSVTEGSVIVTGTGTSFTTDVAPGDHIKIGENALIVSTIYSDTTLTLTSPYPGETASGLLALRLPQTPCSPIYNPEASSCPDTKLNNPAGLFVDSDQDRLYVSNGGTDCADPPRRATVSSSSTPPAISAPTRSPTRSSRAIASIARGA